MMVRTHELPGGVIHIHATDLAGDCPTCSELEAENARLQEKLKHCGQENCMGYKLDDAANWVREERLSEVEAQSEQRREELEKMAQLYHEAKHLILGEVDRERFPSYLDCPYWPCVDTRAAIDVTPEQARGEAQIEKGLEHVAN